MATDQWIVRFTRELESRELSGRIRDEVANVREHIRDAGGDADDAFGDPVAYAATLASPMDHDTPSRSAVLALFASIGFFILFSISAVAWVRGDLTNAPWAIARGAGLLISVAALSTSRTRRAVSEALRESLTQSSDTQWRVSSLVLLIVPWTFIGFAALVVAIAALI